MARFMIEVTKEVPFNRIAEKWVDASFKANQKNTEQMRQAVRENIVNRGNIDTTTLMNNLQSRTTESVKGNISIGVVESNVRSNPKGHRGYAIPLEYGTNDTRAYPNFRDALDEYSKVIYEKLSSIKI